MECSNEESMTVADLVCSINSNLACFRHFHHRFRKVSLVPGQMTPRVCYAAINHRQPPIQLSTPTSYTNTALFSRFEGDPVIVTCQRSYRCTIPSG
jgi:hypothetical protein